MINILITGGSGFIGSHITERLLTRGNRILVIDNYATGRRDNLQPDANLKVVAGTIADADFVNRTFDEFKPEFVVHAAASYKDPHAWAEDTRTNTVGTANVVQAAERLQVRRLIYFQTALCYGLHPLEQPITLSHPIRPDNSSYAISKTAGEQYIALSKLDFISFRLANIIGPRNLSGPLATFYQRLTSQKPCFVMDTRRDFVFVEDLVEVVIKALDGRGQRGAYHVSSNGDYAIKELFDLTMKTLGITLEREVEIRPRGVDDAFTILLDASKTYEDFDWTAATSLETAARRAIEWYKANGVTQAYTHLKLGQAEAKA